MPSRQRRVLTVCEAVLLALFLCACDFSSSPPKSITPTSVPTNRAVTTSTPNSVGQAIPNTKQGQPPSTAAANSATAQQTLQPTRPLPPTPFPYPTYHFTEGNTIISKWRSNTFPITAFNYMNQWDRLVHRGRTLNELSKLSVYAGGEGQGLPGGDPEQGLLVVVTTTTYVSQDLLGGPDVYRTPIKAGPVQIVWGDYSRVLVVAADDTPFLFDVPSRRWLWPPRVNQPNDPAEQDYQARMKSLLISYLPSPPPAPTTVADLLRPEPTDVPVSIPTDVPVHLLPYDEGDPSGAGRLIQGCENPTAGQPFLRRNCWYTDLIDGTRISIGAGFGRKGYGWPVETGLIIVSSCPGDYNNGAFSRYYNSGLYVTPREVRPGLTPTVNAKGQIAHDYDWVKIVNAEGERINLVSGDGVKFTFDLATCHWIVPPVPTETAPLPPVPPTLMPPTELPWYGQIPPGDELNYVLKMEQLSGSVLTAVALTPTPGTPPPPPTIPPTATLPPTATPNYAGSGIIVSGPWPPAQSETFRYRNYWYETHGDQRIAVYAGVEGSNGSRVQGMIKVVVTSSDGKREVEAPAYYKTPTQSGYVQVVGADGEKLRLKTWNGTEFVFDLTSRQWLNP